MLIAHPPVPPGVCYHDMPSNVSLATTSNRDESSSISNSSVSSNVGSLNWLEIPQHHSSLLALPYRHCRLSFAHVSVSIKKKPGYTDAVRGSQKSFAIIGVEAQAVSRPGGKPIASRSQEYFSYDVLGQSVGDIIMTDKP